MGQGAEAGGGESVGDDAVRLGCRKAMKGRQTSECTGAILRARLLSAKALISDCYCHTTGGVVVWPEI